MSDVIQKDIWTERTKNWSSLEILKSYENPNIFQKDFAAFINNFYLKEKMKIIEVGCEAAGTSNLLRTDADIYLLDYNDHIIKILSEAWSKLNKKATIICADMYDMPFDDGTFDIIFNAGVIEHYNTKERNRIFFEYSKKLKTNGHMIIAYPNHHSFPYKLAYTIRVLTNRWPFPKELNIYDLRDSIYNLDLEFIERRVLAKQTVFDWLNFSKPLMRVMIALDKIFHFEGYLTVIVLKKK